MNKVFHLELAHNRNVLAYWAYSQDTALNLTRQYQTNPKNLAGANFCIDVTFEMRTVLSEIHLFNYDLSKQWHHIYMKWTEGEREPDSGETERECVRD